MINNDRNMLPIGALLKQGEYRVERYIASGGFGNTYEVVHTRLPKRFAVKEFFMRGINQREGVLVSVSLAENSESFNQMREKFYKEAERLAVLEESHIVEVTDFFEENQTAYYVMKLIDGESLAATIKRTGKPFSEPEARNVLSQVLPALETVHNQGIYHLDLKPGNIMRDAKGHCWLIDFGASKQLSAKESKTLSTSTGLSYTPGYAPGEQLSCNMNRIGAWTDFYALGATLYNLLSCQTPPEPDDVRYDGERAFRFPASVSDDMRHLVLWLMQPDYPRRPQKVSEITARLAEMALPKDIEEEKTDEQPEEAEKQPELAAPLETSIPTVKQTSATTVQFAPEELVQSYPEELEQTYQEETVVSYNSKRRKQWSWLLACVVVIALLAVIVAVTKGGNGKEDSVGQEEIIVDVDSTFQKEINVDVDELEEEDEVEAVADIPEDNNEGTALFDLLYDINAHADYAYTDQALVKNGFKLEKKELYCEYENIKEYQYTYKHPDYGQVVAGWFGAVGYGLTLTTDSKQLAEEVMKRAEERGFKMEDGSDSDFMYSNGNCWIWKHNDYLWMYGRFDTD